MVVLTQELYISETQALKHATLFGNFMQAKQPEPMRNLYLYISVYPGFPHPVVIHKE